MLRLMIKKLAKSGRNIVIEPRVRFKKLNKIAIGNNVELRAGCQLYAQDNTMDKNKVNQDILIRIGNDVHIKENANLSTYGGYIYIGDRSNIGHNCVIYGQGGVSIGKDTLIGPNSCIISGNHKFDDLNRTINKQGTCDIGISIGDDVWIGANVSILDGVTIGNGAVIGAGSVVTKDIGEYEIAFGVPARFFKKRGNTKVNKYPI